MSKHQYLPAALKKMAIEVGATVRSGFIETPTPSGRNRRISAVVLEKGDDRLVYEHKSDKKELFLRSTTKGEDMPYWIRHIEDGLTVNEQLTAAAKHFLAA